MHPTAFLLLWLLDPLLRPVGFELLVDLEDKVYLLFIFILLNNPFIPVNISLLLIDLLNFIEVLLSQLLDAGLDLAPEVFKGTAALGRVIVEGEEVVVVGIDLVVVLLIFARTHLENDVLHELGDFQVPSLGVELVGLEDVEAHFDGETD